MNGVRTNNVEVVKMSEVINKLIRKYVPIVFATFKTPSKLISPSEFAFTIQYVLITP